MLQPVQPRANSPRPWLLPFQLDIALEWPSGMILFIHFNLLLTSGPAWHRTSEDSEEDDEIDGQDSDDEDMNLRDDEDANTQDNSEEGFTGPSEPMEDSVTGDAMNEDFDYGVQRVNKSVASRADTDNEDSFDGPTGMIPLYYFCSSL